MYNINKIQKDIANKTKTGTNYNALLAVTIAFAMDLQGVDNYKYTNDKYTDVITVYGDDIKHVYTVYVLDYILLVDDYNDMAYTIYKQHDNFYIDCIKGTAGFAMYNNFTNKFNYLQYTN